MNYLKWLLASILWMSVCSPSWGVDRWPEFRGPSGDGTSSQAGMPLHWSETENVVWKTAIHDRGWSSPVVWEDQIWLTTATPDGKRLFALSIDKSSGQIRQDIHLFDVEQPREIHLTNSYASPTPVIEQGRVYVSFGSYGTACLATATGKILWQRRDLPCNHWRGPGSSPILFENLLILHFDGYDYQYVVALDKLTGKTVWKRQRDIDYQTDDGDFKKAFCTPTVIRVDGQWQLISPAAKAAISYDPRTGHEIWRIRYDNHSATARPVYGHGLVYINSGFSKAQLFAVRPTGRGDVTDTHVAWVERKGIGSKPSHLLYGDWIFGIHDRGTAACFRAMTGEKIWEKRISGNYSASPLMVAGRIYLFNEAGDATVLQVGQEPTILAHNRLDDGCMASPAVTQIGLLVRTKTHLYLLGKPPASGQANARSGK